MMRIAEAWNAFWYAPSSGHRIAVVRILLGLYFLVYFGALTPHVTLLFSDQGVYVPYWLPDCAPPPLIAHAIFALTLACGVALVLGLRTALVAPLLLLLFFHHYFLQLAVKQSSFDRLSAIYLLVFCFADSGRVWGFDARRPGPRPTVWAERLIGAQTLLLYFGSGLWKMMNPAWHTGVLLHSNLQGMWATPIAFGLVRAIPSAETWTHASWGIIAFELLLAPLLLARRTRAIGLLFGVGFHLFNCVVLVIPEFLVCIAAYPVFVEPETLRRFGDALGSIGGVHSSRSVPRI